MFSSEVNVRRVIKNSFLYLSLSLLLVLGYVATVPLHDKSVSAGSIQGRGGPFSRRENPSKAEIDMENARKKAIKKEQYDSLKKDTDQLLALATELKQDVDKTTENTLSLDVIKKTEEVEKLAKKVREKMRGY
jgi:hypothetical protein